MEGLSAPSMEEQHSPVVRRSSVTTSNDDFASTHSAQVVFQVEANVGFGEEVYVCGNTPSLGAMNPEHGIQLQATTKSWPVFESDLVSLPRMGIVRYKYAVFSGGKFKRWEEIKHDRFLNTTELASAPLAQGSSSGDQSGDLAALEGGLALAATTTSTDVLDVTPDTPPPPVSPGPRGVTSQASPGGGGGRKTAGQREPHSPRTAVTGGIPVAGLDEPPSRFGDWTRESAAGAGAGSARQTLSLSDGLIVVSYFLPVVVERVEKSPSGPAAWQVEWDQEALLSLTSQLRVTRVGTVRFPGEIPLGERDALCDALRQFNCVPIFLDQTLAKAFYQSFCKKTLWPVFHNLLEIYGPNPTGQDPEATSGPRDGTDSAGDPMDLSIPLRPASPVYESPDRAGGPSRDPWGAYMTVQREFKTKIMEIYHEGDLVWIHGFHLLLVPTLFSKAHAAAKIGLFVHTPFPSSEIFRTLSRREDLLRGMLSADQVGFHLYEYARHFLSCCRRLLGLEWSHEANGINIHYGGRNVLVTCIHAGLDQQVLQSVISTPKVCLETRALLARTKGKTVFAGIDRMERLKGVPLKLLAYERFLSEHPECVDRCVLVQLGLSARERSADYDTTSQQVASLVARIQSRFGAGAVQYEEHEEAHCQLKDRLALLSAADVFVVTTVRDGLNRWPLEFVLAQAQVCQLEGDPSPPPPPGQGVGSAAAGSSGSELLARKPLPGLCILSEFTSCCRVLNGALHVNPWRLDDVAKAMHSAVVMTLPERQKRFEMDMEYVRVHTTASWCGRVLSDLKSVKKSADASRYVTLGFGLNRRVAAMKPGFDQLDKGAAVKAYRKAKHRLLLLDYGGTLYDDTTQGDAISSFALAKGGLKRGRPDAKVLNTLKELCADKRNTVFVLSGKMRAPLEEALGDVPGLGLVAEAGFFFRRPRGAAASHAHKVGPTASLEQQAVPLREGAGGGDAEAGAGGSTKGAWESLSTSNDMSWQTIARAVMEVYMERTHGVYIEQTDSAVVWQFRDADPEFAAIQSKELEDQLKQLLKQLNAEVIRGDDYIEVRPEGVSKAGFIGQYLEEAYSGAKPLDFILCIGDDASDERSYQVVRRFMRTAHLSKLASVLPGQASLTLGHRPAASGGGGSIGSGSLPGRASSPPPAPGEQGEKASGQAGAAGAYFTATVGKKPTLADSYLHQVEDVVEMLESMSKTKTLEHSMSMVDMSHSSRPANSLDGLFSGPGAGGGPPPGSPPSMGGGLHSIDELPTQPLPGRGGAFPAPLNRKGSLSRSMSTPAISSAPIRRPSSMMLSEYFSSISESTSGKPAAEEEEEAGGEGVWF